MYRSVSLNRLLGSRGNEPDNTSARLPPSPVKTLRRGAVEGRGEGGSAVKIICGPFDF